MVRRHQEDLDLLCLVGGCGGQGSVGYLSALLDLLLEFCKTQFSAGRQEKGHCSKFKPSHYWVSFVWTHPDGEKQTVRLWPAPANGGDAVLARDHPEWYHISMSEHTTDLISRESASVRDIMALVKFWVTQEIQPKLKKDQNPPSNEFIELIVAYIAKQKGFRPLAATVQLQEHEVTICSPQP